MPLRCPELKTYGTQWQQGGGTAMAPSQCWEKGAPILKSYYSSARETLTSYHTIHSTPQSLHQRQKHLLTVVLMQSEHGGLAETFPQWKQPKACQ